MISSNVIVHKKKFSYNIDELFIYLFIYFCEHTLLDLQQQQPSTEISVWQLA